VYFIEYGFIMTDRICMHFPELQGNNNCCKFCYTPGTTTTSSSLPCPPPYCYDCTWDEIWYAILATLIVWRVMRCCFGDGQRSGYWYYWSEKTRGTGYEPYSPMVTAPLSAYEEGKGICCGVACSTCFCALIATICTYYFINCLDYWVTVCILKKEMCIKLFSFEYSVWDGHIMGDGSIFGIFDWYDWHSYSCGIQDIVCWLRLSGLMLVTWMSVWWVYVWAVLSEAKAVKEILVTETTFTSAEGYAAGGL